MLRALLASSDHHHLSQAEILRPGASSDPLPWRSSGGDQTTALKKHFVYLKEKNQKKKVWQQWKRSYATVIFSKSSGSRKRSQPPSSACHPVPACPSWQLLAKIWETEWSLLYLQALCSGKIVCSDSSHSELFVYSSHCLLARGWLRPRITKSRVALFLIRSKY